jgi:hypothetical protein
MSSSNPMNVVRGIRLFTWLPIVGIVALIAWATRWWVALIAVVYFGITIGGMQLYRHRLKRRFENDPDGARAYGDRQRRRVFRWGKAAGLLYVGMLLGLLLLVIVVAAVGGHG